MLPKFRPATLGRDASARPSIRPVRPSPPPPPPSPPRKVTSGVGRSQLAAYGGPATEREDDGVEMPTVTGHAEPATLTRGPETVAFEQAITNRRPRAEMASEPISFEEETQARAVDNDVLDTLRRGNDPRVHALNAKAPVVSADLDVQYESLPSLEVRRPYDTYEGEFSERDPVTQLHAEARARGRDLESASVRRAPEASYREPSYNEPSYPAPAPSYAQNDGDVWGRGEGSGPRSRPVPPPAASSYAAPVPAYDDASVSAQWGRDPAEPPQDAWAPMAAPQNDAHFESPMIPAAPRLPEEMHPAFVVGVQPIRTATPDAWGTPHAMAPQGQYVPAHAAQPQYQPQPQAYAQQHYAPVQAQHVHPNAPSAMPSQPAGYLQGSGPHARDPRYMTPPPMHASGMAPSMRQPLSAQLEPAPSASKVGRFAWFVAGAAFGITFAFFATGFFAAGGASAPKDEFPAAPALTAPAAPVVPPVAVAPVAPPVAVAPVAPPVQAAAPAVPPVAVAPVAPPAQAVAPAAPPAAVAPAAPALAVAPPVAAIAAAALPAAAPVAVAPVARPAPPPARPRFQAPPPRRPAAPVSQAPKNLGGGGAGADDERPAAPSAPAGSEFGDLLGAGLKP
jgi:hypothetical protein